MVVPRPVSPPQFVGSVLNFRQIAVCQDPIGRKPGSLLPSFRAVPHPIRARLLRSHVPGNVSKRSFRRSKSSVEGRLEVVERGANRRGGLLGDVGSEGEGDHDGAVRGDC